MGRRPDVPKTNAYRRATKKRTIFVGDGAPTSRKQTHTAAQQKEWLVKAAKRLITLWGDEISSVELHDYAAREYPEMLSLFYKPRWKKYINSLDRSLKANQPWNDYDRYADESQFVNRDAVYPKQKSSALSDDIHTVLQFFDPIEK